VSRSAEDIESVSHVFEHVEHFTLLE
jgi:hypothetical protein